ncbi:hypothetical protein GQ457_01G005930 [Hibiscus cannabinus]
MSCGKLVPSQDHGNLPKENRRLANYIPDVWGLLNWYENHSSFQYVNTSNLIILEQDMDCITRLEHEELKEQLSRMLVKSMDDPSQTFDLIDAVQRLGVAYHFPKEIEDALQHHCNHVRVVDLYTTALRFRLLREDGFDVGCGTYAFNKFKDKEGELKESLISDVKGMLELYEAAHFQLHGENILEEALSFTKFHLKSAETKADNPLSRQIANALNRPLRKSLTRMVARSYISIYEDDQNLLKFAKLDFKIVQHLHRKEINELSRWWKGLDFATNFSFTRDRLAECYF